MKKSVSLKKRLIVYFILLSLIPLLFIEIVSTVLYRRTIMQNVSEFSVQTMRQTAIEVENIIDNTEMLAEMICNEQLILAALRRPEEGYAAEKTIDLFQINEHLQFIQDYNADNISCIYIVGKNGTYFKSGYVMDKFGKYNDEAWFQQ